MHRECSRLTFHTGDYDQAMIQKFDKLVADQNYRWNLRDILPRVLAAGEEAGVLTEEGASLLDPSGDLQAGIPLCPRRVMQEPVWSQRTALRNEPVISLQEPPYLPW